MIKIYFKWQRANAREEVVVAPLVVYYSTDFVSHCDYDTAFQAVAERFLLRFRSHLNT